MFQTFFWQPILNTLFFFFNFTKDFGFSIILTTITIRMILWPLFTQNEVIQKKMQKVQPEIKKIQAEYKKEPQKQTAMLLDIYKTNKINPSFAFFFAFIQIFFIFGLFSAFTVATKTGVEQYIYPFITLPPQINFSFLGMIDLSQPSLIFAILATVTQVIHGMITLKHLKNDDPQKNMMKIFTYVFPIIFILNFKHFKSAIFLYWTILTLINIAQTIYVRKQVIKS